MPGRQAPKPSRSDEIQCQDEQARIAERIRLYFESAAPKRPPKPSRSESMDESLVAESFPASEIPEYVKFQHLESSSQSLFHGNCHASSDDEFIETDYYKDLNAADKNLHYTTGAGYIQLEANRASKLQFNGNKTIKSRITCNPAMNDWIPSEEVVIATTKKPQRSDP